MMKTLPLFIALLAAVPVAAHAAEYPTRFGNLVVDEDNLLHFKGQAVEAKVQGNNSLSVEATYQFPGYDLVLVQDNGGTGCPAEYYVVKVTRAGAVATEAFGTCSDLARPVKTKTGLTVSMPGFASQVQGEAAERRAARERHTFTYAAGQISESVR